MNRIPPTTRIPSSTTNSNNGTTISKFNFTQSSINSDNTFDNGIWEIKSVKLPISNSSEIDRDTDKLGFPLPEMIFGNNYFQLTHKPTKFSLKFHPIEALELVDTTGVNNLKVSYAKEWAKERQEWEEIKYSGKTYDWTYRTKYTGSIENLENIKIVEDCSERIDIEKLKLPEPILFYNENMLFEDELGDNGSALLNVKVRVMPSGFFILQRYFLRVDDVLFQINDTRVYHDFKTNYLVKEYSSKKCEYSYIKNNANFGDDLTLMNDVNFISQLMSNIPNDEVKYTKIELI